MENLTLGQISAAVLFLTALVGGIILLVKWIRSVIVNVMKAELEPMQKQLTELREESRSIDLENCKNFLVTYLAETERNAPHDPIEQERFWEEYEHYQKRGGNSYIKQKVDKLKAEQKI